MHTPVPARASAQAQRNAELQAKRNAERQAERKKETATQRTKRLAEKHRRKASAAKTIKLLNDAVADETVKLSPGVQNQNVLGHLLKGVPINRPDDTTQVTGLHAYTGGTLPQGVERVGRRGRATKPHELDWTRLGPNDEPLPSKTSSMFPSSTTREHMIALMALKAAKASKDSKFKGQLHIEDMLDSIPQARRMVIEQKGDTMFPKRAADKIRDPFRPAEWGAKNLRYQQRAE
jgi:hypothetical protein